MADNYNFINCGRRTELVKNPDQYGNGITIGYYRQGFSNYRAVMYVICWQSKTDPTDRFRGTDLISEADGKKWAEFMNANFPEAHFWIEAASVP